MTKTEAIAQQRRYRRRGFRTWTSRMVISGREADGLVYHVHILDGDGRCHTLKMANERIGSTRNVVI